MTPCMQQDYSIIETGSEVKLGDYNTIETGSEINLGVIDVY